MSVNCQKPSSSLKSLLPLLRSCMGRQLAQYRAYFSSAQNQIVNTLQMHVLQQKNQSLRQQQTIQQLRKQIQQLKEDNSFLRNQYMLAILRGEQLQKSRHQAVKDAEGKDARVIELAEEVDNFKDSALGLQDDDLPVDFDAESPIKGARFEGLEVIKEVSEHDLSISMSLQSCPSDLFETRAPSDQIQPLLGDYHDALQILKSYTNSSLPLSHAIQDSDKQRHSKKNDTISRIKRMRKIQDHPLDNQQNICSIGNDASQLQDGFNNEQLRSSVSLVSHKFHSRIKQSLLSLEDPVKLVKETLDDITTSLSKPQKRQNLQEGYIKLGYVGGLEYLGRSDSIGNPSGFGKLLLNGECIYQGQWRNGKFHGWGKLILLAFGKDKQRRIIQIDGHFKGGIADGSVVCTFNNGERFMGLMREGSLERQGSFVGERGVLTGVWEGSRLIYLL